MSITCQASRRAQSIGAHRCVKHGKVRHWQLNQVPELHLPSLHQRLTAGHNDIAIALRGLVKLGRNVGDEQTAIRLVLRDVRASHTPRIELAKGC